MWLTGSLIALREWRGHIPGVIKEGYSVKMQISKVHTAAEIMFGRCPPPSPPLPPSCLHCDLSKQKNSTS